MLKISQMIGYLKDFDDSITMSFRVHDGKLFKKYCKMWRTIKSLLGIEFDSEPVYGDADSYIKTKVKMYDNRVNTNFQAKKVPKGDSSYNCLPLIMLESVVKVGKKNYTQVFLEECTYVKRKNKMMNYIDDIDITSSDENDESFIVNLIMTLIIKYFYFVFFFLYNFSDILSFFLFFLIKYCFSSFFYNFSDIF